MEPQFEQLSYIHNVVLQYQVLSYTSAFSTESIRLTINAVVTESSRELEMFSYEQIHTDHF